MTVEIRGKTKYPTKLKNGDSYHQVVQKNVRYWRNSITRKYEHVEVAEEMLGRNLLPEEEVHHRNHDGLDNDPSNLEVCTRREHKEEHRLERALEECGDVTKFKCIYCGCWDDPRNMTAKAPRKDRGGTIRYQHKECYSKSKKKWWANRTPEQIEREKVKQAENYKARTAKLAKEKNP